MDSQLWTYCITDDEKFVTKAIFDINDLYTNMFFEIPTFLPFSMTKAIKLICVPILTGRDFQS